MPFESRYSIMSQPKKSFLSFFLLALLFAFSFFASAFRVESGTDYLNYVLIYNHIGSGGVYWGYIEPGFVFLVTFLQSFGFDARAFFISSSFLILLFFFLGWANYSNIPTFSFFIFFGMYYYFHSFNISRQFISVAIFFFFSYRPLLEKKFLRYGLVVFLSSMFHLTAVLMLPIYFLLVRRWSYFEYFFIFLFFLVVFLSYPYIAPYAFSLFASHEGYINYHASSANAYLLSFISLTFLSFSFKKSFFSTPHGRLLFNCMVFSVFICLLSYYNIIFFRVSIYLGVFITLLLPAVAYSLSFKNRFVYLLFSITIVILNFSYHAYRNIAGIFPYSISLGL